MAFNVPECSLCGKRVSPKAWYCSGCRVMHVEIRGRSGTWPAWGRVLRDSEQQRRRLARKESCNQAYLDAVAAIDGGGPAYDEYVWLGHIMWQNAGARKPKVTHYWGLPWAPYLDEGKNRDYRRCHAIVKRAGYWGLGPEQRYR